MEGNQFHYKTQQVHSTIINVVDVSDNSRFPQWSIEETKEFLMIRGELDQAFMETKRNKQLWELISNHMRDKGYHRSAEQCKCKWKNIVNRYKGCETMETQQFPFYNELQEIFTESMQRMLWAEAEAGSKKKKKAKIVVRGSGGSNNRDILSNLKEILEEFMKQQMQMEIQWMEAFEARENERRLREMEWRQQMELLENEKIMIEQRWREREEQRMIREEARAEKRDALITALLNMLQRK